MSNKSDGNKFESVVSKMLHDNGFWVHKLAPNSFGQPADIIAVKNGRPFLIDAKMCSNGKFRLDRIEENQEYAMLMWCSCGNGYGWFALGSPDGDVYMMTLHNLLEQREEKSSIDITDGIPLDTWMRYYG